MTDSWTVSFDTTLARPAAALADRLLVLLDHLEGRAPVAHSASNGRRYGASFCVEADDPADAVAAGLKVFREAAATAGMPAGVICAAEALTADELRRRNRAPTQAVVGVHEVSLILDVSPQRVSYLAGQGDFPEPLARLKAGPVWARPAIERYAANRVPRKGRPRSAQGGDAQ